MLTCSTGGRMLALLFWRTKRKVSNLVYFFIFISNIIPTRPTVSCLNIWSGSGTKIWYHFLSVLADHCMLPICFQIEYKLHQTKCCPSSLEQTAAIIQFWSDFCSLGTFKSRLKTELYSQAFRHVKCDMWPSCNCDSSFTLWSFGGEAP